MPDVTIYHTRHCGTSRNTLGILRHAGLDPTVVEYLKTPPSKDQGLKFLHDAGLTVREVLREMGTPYSELNLADTNWSDEELLAFIGRLPILMNRPIVATSLGTKLCKPSEAVPEILRVSRMPDFVKEDGERVVDTGPRRLVAGSTERQHSLRHVVDRKN